MRALSYLKYGFWCIAVAQAVPLNKRPDALTGREEADEDDKVVYAWALPVADKLKREEADEDDNVVYAWALPDTPKSKREEADEDDDVVYAWALPDGKK